MNAENNTYSNKDLLLVCVVIGVLVGVGGMLVGRDIVRAQAIHASVAEYYIDDGNNKAFRFKEAIVKEIIMVQTNYIWEWKPGIYVACDKVGIHPNTTNLPSK